MKVTNIKKEKLRPREVRKSELSLGVFFACMHVVAFRDICRLGLDFLRLVFFKNPRLGYGSLGFDLGFLRLEELWVLGMKNPAGIWNSLRPENLVRADFGFSRGSFFLFIKEERIGKGRERKSAKREKEIEKMKNINGEMGNVIPMTN